MGLRQEIKFGSTSVIITKTLRRSDNAAFKTGVAPSAITAHYIRDGEDAVAIPLAAGVVNIWSSGGWVETSRQGVYQLGLPDAALVAGSRGLLVTFSASGTVDDEYNAVLVAEDLRDVTLAEILAKPASAVGGGIAVMGMSSQERTALAKETTAAVWKAKNRTLTAPVEIAGTKKTLDELNDVSRETVRTEVDESNAAQTNELQTALGELETADGATARADVVASAMSEIETKESAATRAGKLGAAIFARIDPVAHAVASIPPAVTLSRDDVREVVEADQAPRFAALEDRVCQAEAGIRDEIAEHHNLTIRELETERAAAKTASDLALAKLTMIDARIQAARKEAEAATAAVAKADERVKVVARGMAHLVQRVPS